MGGQEKIWKEFWPPGVTDDFEIRKPFSEYMRETSNKLPNKVAISFYGAEITYGKLNELIDRFAWGLIRLGLKKGGRVALYMPNCPQFIISYFGILRAGGIVVPLNPMFKHAELEHEIMDSMSEFLIGVDYLYPEVEKIRGQVRLKNVILTSLRDYLPRKALLPLPSEAQESKRSFPGTLTFKELLNESPEKPVCEVSDLKEDLALLQYTGGTTGTPKGAMISHHCLALASLGATNWFQNTENDVYLGVTPFFHIMGMIQGMCSPLFAGGDLVVLSRFVPDVVARAITTYKCTAWVGASAMLIALLQLSDIEQYDFTSFRYVCSGGAPISVELQKRFNELVPRSAMLEGYGLTECVSQGAAITPLNGYKPGFVGVPHLNDIKIVDMESGKKQLPANEEGEIVIRGPCLMKGYWQKPEETEKVLRDGWLYTGDIGVMDEEGYLKVAGRKKELIKCSGYSVFPDEVEDLMYRHPAVAEVAVIGVPDTYRGESPKAFIVLKPEYNSKTSEKEVMEWCKENMAAYKRPRIVEFREELPKSGAGKILRRFLSEEELNKKP